MPEPEPRAETDAERIADLLSIRRRSARWFLGFIVAWALGTGGAAAYNAWNAPWWAWLTIVPAITFGVVVGVLVGRRATPPVDDAIAGMRAHRFRPSPITPRPRTADMALLLLCGALVVAPVAGVFHGVAQADLWAVSGGVFVAAGLTLHAFGRRSAAAIAALPEATPTAAELRTADA